MKYYIVLAVLLLSLVACQQQKSYSLEQLQENPNNQLQLPVVANMDNFALEKLLEKFSSLDTSKLLQEMTKSGATLQEISYGFYYLANHAAQVGKTKEALNYHEIAATQYLNPLSMLKLAQANFMGINQPPVVYPQDYQQAYIHLHEAMETLTEITNNNRSHVLAKATKDYDMYLLGELQRAAKAGKFDEAATREQLKKDLTPMMEQLRAMYQLQVE